MSTPEAALVSVAGQEVSAPGEITLRRGAAWIVVRASKDGYQSTCQVLRCPKSGKLAASDGILVGVPFAIASEKRALHACPSEVSINLTPLMTGTSPDPLPSDAQILNLWTNAKLNVCNDPQLLQRIAWFNGEATRLIVTAGPLARPYEAIGPVDVGAQGNDYTQGFALSLSNSQGFGGGFAHSRRYFSKAPPAQMNELLKYRALELYGSYVDAIVNVTYQDNPRNDVFATGLAVHYVPQVTTPARTSQDRMQELRRLFEQGHINRNEYDRKRAELLREL